VVVWGGIVDFSRLNVMADFQTETLFLCFFSPLMYDSVEFCLVYNVYPSSCQKCLKGMLYTIVSLPKAHIYVSLPFSLTRNH
jgi:hypothetical protein